MRISDWSSDVCSSVLGDLGGTDGRRHKHPFDFAHIERCRDHHCACEQGELSCPCAHEPSSRGLDGTREVGRGSGRERVVPYGLISVVVVTLTKTQNTCE